MIVCRTLTDWRTYRQDVRLDLGLVPTMGALHAGHIALIERARAENQFVAVTIFVNPTQFDQAEDFEKYPRDLERDLEALHGLADVVFCPSAHELYPEHNKTIVEVIESSDILLGKTREGHFRGVTTVVMKLLNITQPTRAYFGEKDYQQLHLIRRMAADLFIPTQIVGVPSVRDRDGLALSSRNQRLTVAERGAAVIIPNAITLARALMDEGASIDDMHTQITDFLQSEPLAEVVSVDLCDPATLQPWQGAGRPVLLLVVRFGKVMLIDQAEL